MLLGNLPRIQLAKIGIVVNTPSKRPKKRRSPGWVPNQHGAWAMLASPLAVGALAGGLAWIHLPLAAFWFAGYFAFFATTLWLKARRMPRHFPPVRFYVLLASALGILVLLLQPQLLKWAPFFALPLGVGLYAASHKKERALLAGIATISGSALMTVVAYDAGATGTDLNRAWLLAAAQFLYFAGTVFYVKTIIRERDNKNFYRLSVGYHALAVVLIGLLFGFTGSALTLVLVFVILLDRAVLVPKFKVTPKQIGIGEIFSTIAVALASLFA